MVINSKRKGSDFERKICKLMTELTKTKFYRTPCSGALATTDAGSQRFKGDIYCESEDFKDLVIECKATKKPIEIHHLFQPKSLINKFVEQCIVESKGDCWALFIKVNNRKEILIMPYHTRGRYFKIFEMKQVKSIFLDFGGMNLFHIFYLENKDE